MEDATLDITLKDGRSLSYTEYGDPSGSPVFYFHGFPGSRLDWRLTDPENRAARAGIRILALDRPGMGRSTRQSGRRLLDWPGDVAGLADVLGIERFAVVGVSGGGPYALASAHALPERVTAAAVVCGMGPAGAPGMTDGVSWTLPRTPGLLRLLILQLMAVGLRKDPEKFMARTVETFSEPDRELLADPAVERALLDGMREALHGGIRGANDEAAIYRRRWGFELREITAPVFLWHGGRDVNVPISVGRFVAESIPGCQPTFLDEEGHLTLAIRVLDEVLARLRSPSLPERISAPGTGDP